MADTKITALTAISTVDPAVDVLPIVDVSDTTMAASGTTKKITSNQILGAGGTATLASATITGDLTVDTSTLKVDSTNNRVIVGHTSGSSAFQVTNAGAAGLEIQPTGFSSAPLILSYNRSGSAYTQLTLDGSTIVHALSGSTAMTLNSTGLGVGVAPSAWSTTFGLKATQVYNSALASNGTSGYLTNNAYYAGAGYTPTYINASSTPAQAIVFNSTGVNDIQFLIGAAGTAGNAITFTQAMTLDASGNLLVGVTSTTVPGVANTTAGVSLNASGAGFFSHASSQALYLNTNVDGQLVSIRRSGLAVGSISVTTTATTYNTISDYRLKEAVHPLVGGLARVNALKPSSYNWKSDGSNGEGFIAHELAEVVPLAVTGEKDAVNEDGSIKPQGVDLSKVVPILVAAIQELTARVQTLEAK
jgi:hypothetical protein